MITWELPWVEAVEVEEGDELDVEAFSLDLAPEVELDQLLLRGVEPEPRHHHVVVVRVAGLAAAVTTHRHLRGLSSCRCDNAADSAVPVLEVSAHGIARAGSDGEPPAGSRATPPRGRSTAPRPRRRRRIWGREASGRRG